ncbi:MAG: cell division protein SepF [Actinomycetota bacterium]
MSMLKRMMTWLGLDPDADYEYGSEGGPGFNDPALGVEEVTPVPMGAVPPAPAPDPEGADFSAVRSLGPMSEDSDYTRDDRAERAMSNTSLQPVDVVNRDDPPMGSVTAVPASPTSKPQLVAPRSFNDSQEVADRFRGGAPVILNLQETDAELGRRLIDFCSGLCYALNGKMERVGDRVFLVTPAEVKLSPDDHHLIRDSGLLG